jgi:sigma-B regulation protein RsbU (phosphoserine phosphatase)
MTFISDKASILRLRFCNFKLDSLLNVTQAINDNVPTDFLLRKYERILKEELKIGKILLFQFSNSWEIILESGYLPKTFDGIDVEDDLLTYDEITTTSEADNILLHAFDIVIPVFHNKKPIAYVLIGDIDEETEGVSPTIKHLRFIQTLTNIIMVAIENKRLYEANLREEAMRKELELASKMQEMLVPDPKTFPHNDRIYIDAYYLPYFKVGGDYYDYIKLSPDEFGFCIADVSGKGIPAALLMSNFQASLRALFTFNTSLPNLVTKLNEIVVQNTQGDKFITLFIGKYSFTTKLLHYINAGHNPPTVYNSYDETLTFLEKGCTGLGMLERIPKIEEGCITIGQNTKLLLYTDGVVELEDNDHILIGMEAIKKQISSDKKIDKVIEGIIKELDIRQSNSQLFDDITMLGLEFY